MFWICFLEAFREIVVTSFMGGLVVLIRRWLVLMHLNGIGEHGPVLLEKRHPGNSWRCKSNKRRCRAGWMNVFGFDVEEIRHEGCNVVTMFLIREIG